LFASDLEIAVAIVGKDRAAKWLKASMPALNAIPGFPKVDSFHGGRPVPLVRLFYVNFMGIDGVTSGRPHGELGEWKGRKRKVLDELMERPDSAATLDGRHIKVLRYMRDHTECETALEIRGAGEHTLNFLKDKGMTEVVGADSKGRARFKLTRQGKEELAGIDRWESQHR
jgi:hypothetical protein